MSTLTPTRALRLLGLSSPWCLSSTCQYLEPDRFHGGAAETVALAARDRRLYCFERGGEVMVGFHWLEDAEGGHHLGAIALRGGADGPLSGEMARRVHAAATFALGVVRYRGRASGGDGTLWADLGVEGAWAADLRALGFLPGPGGWLLGEPRAKSRLGARLASARLRMATRR
jgi:hypothetical protein